MGQYRDVDHQEDAPHFMTKNLKMLVTFLNPNHHYLHSVTSDENLSPTSTDFWNGKSLQFSEKSQIPSVTYCYSNTKSSIVAWKKNLIRMNPRLSLNNEIWLEIWPIMWPLIWRRYPWIVSIVHWLDSELIPRLLENFENWKKFMVI